MIVIIKPMDYLARDRYLRELLINKCNGKIKYIFGSKAVGKTTLINSLYKEYLTHLGVHPARFIDLAKDIIEEFKANNIAASIESYIQDRNYEIRNKSPYLLDTNANKFKHLVYYYIFIDNINEWGISTEEICSFIHQLNQIEHVDVYVTSNREIDLLPIQDEMIRIDVYPFTYREVYRRYADQLDVKKAYLKYGGLPKLNDPRISTVDKNIIINSLIEKVYIPQISKKAEKSEKIKEIYKQFLFLVGMNIHLFASVKSICDEFLKFANKNVTYPFVKNCVNYFKEIGIIDECKGFDIKDNKDFRTLSKFYFTDIGFRNAVVNFADCPEDKLFANVVYTEMRSRGYDVKVGVYENMYKNIYKVTSRKLEYIDFVAFKGDNRCYVTLALDKDQEFITYTKYVYKRINDSFTKFILVKGDALPTRDEKGIIIEGIEHFLISDDLFIR